MEQKQIVLVLNTGTSSNNGTWYWRVKANTTGATYSTVQSFVYKF